MELYGISMPFLMDLLSVGEAHPCPYLPEQRAREEFFAIEYVPPELYHDLMDHGFRRSGLLFYRPICESCRECRPVRILVDEFRPSKSQRRVLRKNADLDVRLGPLSFSRGKYELYSEYLRAQHRRTEYDSFSEVRESLYASPVATLEFEYRLDGRLVAASIADLCSRSLSSVYVYFDPKYANRSLGTFSALREIMFCQEHRIPYYYLGFLVSGCPSMNYKAKFQPYQLLDASLKWEPYAPAIKHAQLRTWTRLD